MNVPPDSSRFELLFDVALKDYEKQTGTKLLDHPLAKQLETCDTVESVTAFFQVQVLAFRGSQAEDGKVMKPLKCAVHVLHTLSTSTALGEGIGLLFPPAKGIFTGLAILLAAVQEVSSSVDALLELLESIGNLLNRLEIYTKMPHTAAMTEIMIKIMIELISTLALATKQVKEGRSKKFVKKLLGENELGAVLQRLDRLTQDEARTTAAQTLEVVYGLVQNMKVVMDDGKASADSIRDALKIVQQYASDRNKAKREELQEKVRNWLSPPDPWKNHNVACNSHHDGTATWFLEGDTFTEWKASGPSSLLWIHGKPGAGKSVLCSSIIEDIDEMRRVGLASLAFFYCDFRDDKKKDRRGLLSSLLVQLCDQSDSYCDILSDFYVANLRGSRYPSDGAILQCIHRMLKLSGEAPVFIVVDALDELPNTTGIPSSRDEVLNLLEEFISLNIPNLRICVTSRPEADIRLVLDRLALRSISLHGENGQMEDIVEYIRSVVTTDPMMRRWKTGDKEMVIDTLTQKADGMFRWVFCQLAYLRRCIPARIRRALDELPETLDETYGRTLQDIDEQNWEYAHRIFECVAVASRPLRVEELAEFLAFDFNPGIIIPTFLEDWRPADPGQAVLSTCASLLSIIKVGDSQVIEFSHFSVKEYLTSMRLSNAKYISSRYHVSTTAANTMVAQACLGALLHLDENVNRNSLKGFPLIEYAAEHLVEHVRFEGVSVETLDGMKRLFDPGKPHLAIWVWLHDPIRSSSTNEQHRKPSSRPPRTPLHYAAVHGLHDIVQFLVLEHSQKVNAREISNELTPLHVVSSVRAAELLLEHGADPMSRDVHKRTPLHIASLSGMVEVARLLLERGADAMAQDTQKQTALHRTRSVEVVQLLLNHGANVTAQDERKQTPLHHALSVGVAKLLLEHGADATAQSDDKRTPLHGASSAEVAQLLLEHGADATAKDDEKRTPLHEASDAEVVQLLLEHGADPTAQDEHKRTPLHRASRVEVVRLLLQHGADPTIQDEKKRTPLHKASSAEVARLLLEHGADAAAQDQYKRTPLHRRQLNVELARVLLEGGADATAQDQQKRTPLHGEQSVEIVRLLLKHGADPTAQGDNKQTPLHEVSSLEVAQLLLEHGADPAAKDEHDRTPLYGVRSAEIAELLLEYGADPTAQDKYSMSPLHGASSVEVARILLERGADPTAPNQIGWTPLHGASSVELVQLLLEHGADPTAQDNQKCTPLHVLWAPYWEDVKIVQLLLDYGADPTAQDERKRTPLHAAMSVEVAQLLVEHGADVTAPDGQQRTPLHGQWSMEIARFLLDHGADPTAPDQHKSTPLHGVTRAEVARLLLEHGADPTAQDEHKQTPLHVNSTVEVARLLLKYGADVTAQDEHKRTPLHNALTDDVVRLLLEHGADATAEDEYKQTPLHNVSRVEVARLLLEHGADVTAQDEDKQTPLHVASASIRGDVKVARLLLKHGADVMTRDKNMRTPLHVATMYPYGDVQLTRLLLDHGADAKAQDNDKRTPLHGVSTPFPGDVDIVRLLLDHGADPTTQDKYMWSPLHVALKMNTEVTQLFLERGADASAQDNASQTPFQAPSADGRRRISYAFHSTDD